MHKAWPRKPDVNPGKYLFYNYDSFVKKLIKIIKTHSISVDTHKTFYTNLK